MNDDDLRSAFTDLLQDLPNGHALPAATASRVRRRRQLKTGAVALGGAGAVATVAALVLVATSPRADRLDQADPPAPSPTSSTSPVPTTSPSPSPPAPSPSAPSPSAPSPAASPSAPADPQPPQGATRVVLRPDGLGLVDGGSSTSALAFGTDAATVRAALDRALGEGGPMETPDCGAGSVTVQYERIFVLLQDDAFVGWVTGSPGPTTGDGIGVGSTLADLRASYPDLQVSESPLGVEWTTARDGGLAGFLDGAEQSSVVNNVRGGVSCIAR